MALVFEIVHSLLDREGVGFGEPVVAAETALFVGVVVIGRLAGGLAETPVLALCLGQAPYRLVHVARQFTVNEPLKAPCTAAATTCEKQESTMQKLHENKAWGTGLLPLRQTASK